MASEKARSATLAETIESLKDRLGESSSVRSAAEATVVQLRSQLETLQRRCEELTADYEEAQDGNRTASESITRLRADLDAAEKRVGQVTTELADLNEKYSEVVDIVENNKADLEEAHKTIADLESKIAGIEEQGSGTAHMLQNALQNQQELETTLTSERKARLQEITALREKTNGLEKDILSVKQEKDKLQGQVKTLEDVQAQYVEKENSIMERARRGLLVSLRLRTDRWGMRLAMNVDMTAVSFRLAPRSSSVTTLRDCRETTTSERCQKKTTRSRE